MKNQKSILGFIILFALLPLCSNGQNEGKQNYAIPEIDGEWWQVTNTYPDISPYEYTKGDNKVCDFTIFQASDGTWQCIACIRGNTYPGSNRFLFRWQAKNLTDKLWKEVGVFQATGVSPDEEDGFGFVYDESLYPRIGRLQAPHCFQFDNKYYLFYNNSGAFCKVSDDGLNWTDLKNDEGNYTLFRMGRDVMVFDDTEYSGNWIAYYTTGAKTPQFMGARTCKTLTGKWSGETQVYDGWSNTRKPIYNNEFAESPFVWRYKDKYYLLAQLHVFVSDNPLDFNDNNKIAVLEDQRPKWAPEIIIHDNQYYIAAYRPNGIWMAKIKWTEK